MDKPMMIYVGTDVCVAEGHDHPTEHEAQKCAELFRGLRCSDCGAYPAWPHTEGCTR